MTVLNVASTQRLACTRTLCPARPTQPGMRRAMDAANQVAPLMRSPVSLPLIRKPNPRIGTIIHRFKDRLSSQARTAYTKVGNGTRYVAHADGLRNLSDNRLSGILSAPMVLINSFLATQAVTILQAVQHCGAWRSADSARRQTRGSIN